MSNYTVKQVISEQKITTYSDEFIVRDQSKWKQLRDMVSEYLDSDEMNNIPEAAPDDPKEWLALYQKFPDRAFGKQVSEHILSAENSRSDYWCELYDKNDDLVE